MNETEHWKTEAIHLRRMMNGATDALMAHDTGGRFVDVNERACQNLGYSREELLQMSVGDVEANFLGRYVARYLGAVWARLQPGQSIKLQGRHRRKDGSTFPVEVHLSLLSPPYQSGRRILLARVRDVSEQLEVQPQLHEVQVEAEHTNEAESLESATRLFSLNQALVATLESLTKQSPSSSIELDAFLGRVMKEACRQTGAVGGHLFLVEEPARFSAIEARTLRLHASAGEEANSDLWRQPLSIGDSLSWQRLLLTRIPLVINFERTDFLLWPHSAAWHREQGHTDAVSVALKDGHFLGVLCLAFRGRKVDAEEIELAQTFAHQAALAVQLTRLALTAEHEASRRAVVDERNRMAREVHDVLAQSFTGIVAHLEAAQVVLPPGSQVQGLVGVARDLARDGLQEARRSLLALHPLHLEEGGLSEALVALLRETAKVPPPATLRVEGEVRPLPSLVENNLLRIAQEALANARCHSGATRIEIILRFDSQTVELCVRDDGQGFDVETPHPKGYGLTSMSDRATKIGGSWSIESRPDHGTQVEVVVPLEEMSAP